MLCAAEAYATNVQIWAAAPRSHLDKVWLARIEAQGTEAMLTLFEREFDRAPWDFSEGRADLIGELITCSMIAVRLVRAGLGILVEQLS